MTSSELLINIKPKDIPPKTSRDYEDFWNNEAHKVEYGVTINGIFITPWLYWHTNLWNIYIDDIDPINNIIKRVFTHSAFRDNEWIIAEGLEEAEQSRMGMMLFGSRRLGKSEFLASYIARKATIFKGSENIISGGNWGDIDIITSKLVMGLNALPPHFKFGRLSENLRKEVELGFKSKRGSERLSWSKIIMRNFEDGNNTEAAAGLTASSFVIDEVGKFPFSQSFEAAKPAFTSPYGWRCSPILTGTSGDIKKSSDAEKFFSNPDAYNFIVRHLKEEGDKKVSIFISGLRRMEGKYETTIAKYVEHESGIIVPSDSELHHVKFLNSDFKKAEEIIDDEREKAKLSPDPTALLKAIMYYPKNTKELFLIDNGNNFPIEAINETIAFLQTNPEQQGTPVRLYRNSDNRVCASFQTNKKALNDYPITDQLQKDAAVIIYEMPELDPPTYLYISGADPYNQSSSKWSSSLGSIFIFKRIMDPIAGTFQRRIVAEYTARPETLKQWHDTVEMLLEFYNCVCLPENEASTFIQYFDSKNKGYMLADGYNFLKEISPSTSITGRTKGLPATTKVQSFYKELVYQYTTELIQIGKSEDGTPITKLGVTRIPSIGLLKELAAYDDDGNFDRYVAFGHTLAHEVWADKIYPFVYKDKKADEPEKIKPPIIKSPFNIIYNNFGRKKNPFGIT